MRDFCRCHLEPESGSHLDCVRWGALSVLAFSERYLRAGGCGGRITRLFPSFHVGGYGSLRAGLQKIGVPRQHWSGH